MSLQREQRSILCGEIVQIFCYCLLLGWSLEQIQKIQCTYILTSYRSCHTFFGLEKPSQKISLTILFPRVLDKSQLGDPMFSALRHSLSAQQNFWCQNYYDSRSTGAMLVSLYTSWIQAISQCYISCGLVNFSLAGGRTCLVGTVMCLIWSNSVHVEGKQTMDPYNHSKYQQHYEVSVKETVIWLRSDKKW